MRILHRDMETLHCGDCLPWLKTLPDNSIDALVTDPPSGIAFMGAAWDKDKGGRKQWVDWLASIMAEVRRVLKPGAYGLVWALPRQSHWTATALEEAGFEIRDKILHLFGTGFPKGIDVSRAIDNELGAERQKVCTKIEAGLWHGVKGQGGGHEGWERPWMQDPNANAYWVTAPATSEARAWTGWNTTLKPAFEEWLLVRKPTSEANIAANVLRWGVGALNIDGCRIGTETRYNPPTQSPNAYGGFEGGKGQGTVANGRWPANAVLSHSEGCQRIGTTKIKGHVGGHGQWGGLRCGESQPARPLLPDSSVDENGNESVEVWQCVEGCPVADLDQQSGLTKSKRRTGKRSGKEAGALGAFAGQEAATMGHDDNGGASRFFYCPKASTSERKAGVTEGGKGHPTTKPLQLMRWFCRLVTPPSGLIVDPFAGSGTTGVAALAEGFRFCGAEAEAAYHQIALNRLDVANGGNIPDPKPEP